jgi:hypothetical protein
LIKTNKGKEKVKSAVVGHPDSGCLLFKEHLQLAAAFKVILVKEIEAHR